MNTNNLEIFNYIQDIFHCVQNKGTAPTIPQLTMVSSRVASFVNMNKDR